MKIAMYFAWLGFYTSAMVYPAVFGSVLYTFTESDQVLEGSGPALGVTSKACLYTLAMSMT